MRKLQLFADASKEKSPLTYLHNSPPKLPEDLEKQVSLSKNFYTDMEKYSKPKTLMILSSFWNKMYYRVIATSILIEHLPGPRFDQYDCPGDIQIGKNLVELVLKQESFGNKINNLNWLYSSNISNIVSEATSRYSNFCNCYRSKVVPKLKVNIRY